MITLHPSAAVTKFATLALTAGALALAGAITASADDLGPFTCTDKSGGVAPAAGSTAAPQVAAIRVAHHSGYDRLVLEFSPASSPIPPYHLTQQASSTFVRDPSGLRSTLDGSAGVRAVFQNTEIARDVPADLKPRLPEIREVANIGDFEAVVSYGIGLKTAACFRVLELRNPTRLVIDVQTPPDATPATTTAASAQPSATTAASTEATSGTSNVLPSDLAATGHPAPAGQPAGMPIAPILLGLLAVTAGLTIAGLRRFVKS
jgi:hypothetical protein